MELKRSGSQPSGKGPDEYFTGMMRIDPLFQAPDPARVLGVSVTFEPGARTAWHTPSKEKSSSSRARAVGWAKRRGQQEARIGHRSRSVERNERVQSARKSPK